jgi:hypothetical protein
MAFTFDPKHPDPAPLAGTPLVGYTFERDAHV